MLAQDTRAILVVGSINVDIQVHGQPHLGSTVKAHDYLCAGGGKGANAALAAARLGAKTAMLGRVGDDMFAKLALKELKGADVDLSDVRERPGKATGNALVIVADDGDKMIVYAPNANDRWEADAERVVAERVRKLGRGSVLITGLEIPIPIVRAALGAARECGVTTVLDPSPAAEMSPELFALCDFITPNAKEAEQLTGVGVKSEKDAARAGAALLAKGVRHACVKLPAGGAACVDDHGTVVVRAPRVHAVDTTGAGDAFAAGLAAGLLEELVLGDALAYAVTASSLAVTKYGAQAAYAERAEFQQLLQEVSPAKVH